jgi:hypothetical protein
VKEVKEKVQKYPEICAIWLENDAKNAGGGGTVHSNIIRGSPG